MSTSSGALRASSITVSKDDGTIQIAPTSETSLRVISIPVSPNGDIFPSLLYEILQRGRPSVLINVEEPQVYRAPGNIEHMQTFLCTAATPIQLLTKMRNASSY
jgi:hypothetical protein